MKKLALRVLAPAALLAIVGWLTIGGPSSAGAQAQATATPIQHLVVIYDENVSFDHYFGTYPRAANTFGEPKFVAKPGTPTVDGLTPELLTHNPNLAQPFRLDRAEFSTCDQLHEYATEQRAADGGKLDRFVEFSGTPDPNCQKTQVMGYYDGNTVTALWNYAQRFAMSDAFFGTTYGPSTPGALNLVAGNTTTATPAAVPEFVSNGAVIGDPEPGHDMCSSQPQITLTGKNVGDLLNAKGVSWGWFQGGFRDCNAEHPTLAGKWEKDYVPHHEPFQYYASTSNAAHTPPASIAEIGNSGAANHQYDLTDFWAAADAGRLPAVSFLKAPDYQDGHASSSGPLEEQAFLVQTINRLQKLGDWSSTAIVVTYDDSDGWYDHRFTSPLAASHDPVYDGLEAQGVCGAAATSAEDRCGPGPRLPLLVLSPYARQNAVSHVQTEQASILRFIEDNWQLGRLGGGSFDARAGSLLDLFDFKRRNSAPLILDPATGNPPAADPPTPPVPTTTAAKTTTKAPTTSKTPTLPLPVPTVTVPTATLPKLP
jgi:phospholipase C